MLTPLQKKQLEKVYYTISHPASYGSPQRLKAAFPKITLKDIKIWLEGQTAYTRHRYRKLKFKTNQVYAASINDCYQADLLDLPKLKKFNNNIRFILVVIDVLSRFAWAIPLKNKTTLEIIKAFKQIFKTNIPLKIVSDQGREFDSKAFRAFLKPYNVKLYFAVSQNKASLAERLIRTIKDTIYRIITNTGNKKYINHLQSIMSAYNSRIHSTTGVAPKDVTVENESLIWNKLYGQDEPRKKNELLKKGDYVRLAIATEAFRKIYTGTFTPEIFIIDRVIKRNPTVYKVRDMNGEIITGSFYASELQKVTLP